MRYKWMWDVGKIIANTQRVDPYVCLKAARVSAVESSQCSQVSQRWPVADDRKGVAEVI